ncbi:ABC transporter permease [Pelomonas sp. SE-A7]|uniref:ABC transporter permease n=1 Tax=Pelomonas sp. SE-A7 TaxID=3054953 RepID=UPI00259CB222|nr:ABC transporter permease [Pelomonas sp. SE-A7]MDM4768466.1 ABC transporter permease [Pelomonas sp. SE-A7]
MSRKTHDLTSAAWVVFLKELTDGLRDRRTLARLLIPAVLMGPLMLTVLSGLIASFEERATQREILVQGMEHAPTLRNFLERQTYTIKAPPEDFEKQLRESKLSQPVLVVPKEFEEQLLNGEQPVVEIVSDSANQRASVGVRNIERMVRGFSSERASLQLALRGVPVDQLTPVRSEERDLANPQARVASLTGMVPMFIIMAVLYGALTAALDSTAGERERGSLEPLMMNPVSPMSTVLGKWGAVALLGMAVALLSDLSFIPAQLMLQSDNLQAMFSFGAREVVAFLLLQLPLAASMGALLMAIAIRSKTFKEAQASSTLVIMVVSMAPMVTLFNPGAQAPWHLWVPGLAQNTLMTQLIKGEIPTLWQLAQPVIVGLALTAVCLWDVARSMRTAVAR